MQPQTQQQGYISTEVLDIHDPSVFLAKEIFLVTHANADLMSALWFPDSTTNTPKTPENIFMKYKQTTQLFYSLYLYTFQHFRNTVEYKLKPEELTEIKQTIEACDGFFKDLVGLDWIKIPQKEITERIIGLNVLIQAYLQILHMIKLHMISGVHQYTDPRYAYRGAGAI